MVFILEVYVWEARGNNVGHASLKLSNGTYISWWPSAAVGKDRSAFQSHSPAPNVSYDRDVQSEDGYQPQVFMLNTFDLNIDEKKIEKWWNKMKEEEKYQLFFNNCCGVVKNALIAGGLKVDYGLPRPTSLIKFLKKLTEGDELYFSDDSDVE